ncbi:MAG: hypothetical protein L3V56_03820, partial [Candidatus Magnetoovum sp. WYHC-5]|nr:hypothetical protein [Candidatus Magnetoovum sp. WYHC-5]
PDNPNTLLDSDGTPLCSAGAKMRHHQYNTQRQLHVFCCPIKRNTHRNGKSTYVAHIDECPQHQDCCPDSTLGPLVYIHADNDLRLYPPIPRNNKQFKTLINLRSANERLNSVTDSYHIDRSCRNVFYGLIRLTLVSIAQHAIIRYNDMVKRSSALVLCTEILDTLHLKIPHNITGK